VKIFTQKIITLFTLLVLFSTTTLSAQENMYSPVRIEAFIKKLESTTDKEIKKLPKKHFHKKKKVVLPRMLWVKA